ncbi:hypothetical protein ACFE04_018751 [Oxalis oulophora]
MDNVTPVLLQVGMPGTELLVVRTTVAIVLYPCDFSNYFLPVTTHSSFIACPEKFVRNCFAVDRVSHRDSLQSFVQKLKNLEKQGLAKVIKIILQAVTSLLPHGERPLYFKRTEQRTEYNISSNNRFSASSADHTYPTGHILPYPNLRIFTFADLQNATKNFKPDTAGDWRGWFSKSLQSLDMD